MEIERFIYIKTKLTKFKFKYENRNYKGTDFLR